MPTFLEEAVALLRETLATSKSETDCYGKTTVDEAAIEEFLKRYDYMTARGPDDHGGVMCFVPGCEEHGRGPKTTP